MTDPDRRISSEHYVLLVEGIDDENVVWHICNRNKFEAPGIIDKKGFDKLVKSISIELKVSGRKAVGILVDANDDPKARWTSIIDKLLKVGITLPNHPDPNGTILVDTKVLPRVGIWLMPDNRIKGILEHFVEQMIPTNDPLWPRSCKYVDDIPETERKFKINNTQKAKIHAWLATRKNPGLRMGTAILAQDFEIDGDLAQTFFTWLQKLFELEKLEEIETNS